LTVSGVSLEFFLKYQKIIFRSLGVLLFLVGFAAYFWTMPKEAMSENEKAAVNLARMEASVKGHSSSKIKKKKPDPTHFVEAIKKTRKKQLQYLTIFSMIIGAGFLLYSFVKKEKD